jgi:hypothetical protein
MSNIIEIPASAQPGETMWQRELRPEKVEIVVSGLLIPNQAFSKRLASELLQAWARIRELEDKLETAEDKLHRVKSWCEAYPIDVFTPPDLEHCRNLLGDTEFTRLNAHSMRHVVNGIAAIATPEAPHDR